MSVVLFRFTLLTNICIFWIGNAKACFIFERNLIEVIMWHRITCISAKSLPSPNYFSSISTCLLQISKDHSLSAVKSTKLSNKTSQTPYRISPNFIKHTAISIVVPPYTIFPEKHLFLLNPFCSKNSRYHHPLENVLSTSVENYRHISLKLPHATYRNHCGGFNAILYSLFFTFQPFTV